MGKKGAFSQFPRVRICVLEVTIRREWHTQLATQLPVGHKAVGSAHHSHLGWLLAASDVEGTEKKKSLLLGPRARCDELSHTDSI